jgi:ubiquinone/menaquinone biosynthesis C-methylase UbiE
MVAQTDTRIRPRALIQRLATLYDEEIRASSGEQYLIAHASLNSIRRQVSVFERYVGFVEDGNRILDWGCNHAPDACMLREVFGDRVTIDGCDFLPAGRFPHFHDFAGLEYRQLQDVAALPYEANTFDTVISSGALEHAAMDYESLKELHRILKVGGHLIITFLPNRLSYSEFLTRRWGRGAHVRLYRRGAAARMLTHYGFLPTLTGYHQFLPAHRAQGLVKPFWALNSVLERTWPLKLFCSSIIIVAKKCSVM